jgi:chromate reductase
MRILGISGSMRRDSHNRKLLRAARDSLVPGVVLLEWHGLADLPAFNEDLEATPPESVRRFRRALDEADALLIATPEYNASIPGALKNAIDWASRPFPDNPLRGKAIAVIGASTGLFGAVWAQAEARKALNHCGARVVESELPVGTADTAFTEAGALADADLAARLRDIVDELVRQVRAPVERAA